MNIRFHWSLCFCLLCGCITTPPLLPANGDYRTKSNDVVHDAVVGKDIILLSYRNQTAYAELPYAKTTKSEIGPLFDINDIDRLRAYYLFALSTNGFSVVRAPSAPFGATTNVFYFIK